MAYSVVAARYANALADVVTAPASGTTPDRTISELRSFEFALRYSPELQNALITPSVPALKLMPGQRTTAGGTKAENAPNAVPAVMLASIHW